MVVVWWERDGDAALGGGLDGLVLRCDLFVAR